MVEGMCSSCLHQYALSAHVYNSADGGLEWGWGQRFAFLEVSNCKGKGKRRRGTHAGGATMDPREGRRGISGIWTQLWENRSCLQYVQM